MHGSHPPLEGGVAPRGKPPVPKILGFIPPGKEGVYAKYAVSLSIFLAWTFLTETKLFVSVYAPSPSAVFDALVGFVYPDMQDPIARGLFAREPFFEHVAETLMRVYGALTIGSFAGVALGMLAGRSRWWGETFKGFVSEFNVVPRIFILGILVAGVPFFGPLLGASGVVLLTIVTTFCVVGNTTFEIARDPEYKKYRDAADALGMSTAQIAFLVEIPLAMPPLVAALRAGLWTALGTTYFGEYMIASDGVGAILSAMVTNTREPELYAIVILGFIVVLPMFVALSYLSRRRAGV